MSARLHQRVAVVTGAASGIGAAIAERFVSEGARVVLVDLQEQAGTEVTARLGDNAVFLRGDVSQEDTIVSAIDLARNRWGVLDIMVNNAGFGGALGTITELTEEDFDYSTDVLLKSVFFGMKHAARAMIPQQSGSIISTASICALRAGYGPHIYSAAKAGVVMLTQSVALELAEHSIRANCICPGAIATPLLGSAILEMHGAEKTAQRIASRRDEMADDQPLRRTGEPSDIASTALFLASDDSAWITGTAHVVDGGILTGPPWRDQRELFTANVRHVSRPAP